MSRQFTASFFVISVLLAAFFLHGPAHGDDSPADAAVRQALTKVVQLDYKETPLNEVAADLQKKLAIPILFDAKALEDVGIDVDTPITFAISNISAKSAIALMLAQLDLATKVKHGVLLITPNEDNMLDIRVYDVADLVCVGEHGEEQPDFKQLIDVITVSLAPRFFGPPILSSLSPFRAAGISAIVVSDTDDEFEKIERLLADLRVVRDRKANATGSSVNAAAHQALTKPIELNYKELPLDQVVADLHAKLSVPVLLDTKALADVGIDPHSPITFAVSNISAKSAIALMLGQLDLVTVCQLKSLLITTPDEAENMIDVRVYDVADLVCDGVPDKSAPEFDQLLNVIQHSISPSTWDAVNNGPGSIVPFHANGISAIVVAHTDDVHEGIEAFFADMREFRNRKATAAQSPVTQIDLLLPRISEAEAAVRQALAKPISFSFQQTPLSKVIDELKQKTGLQIVVDMKALRQSEVEAENQREKQKQAQAPRDESESPPESVESPASKPPVSLDTPVTAEATNVALEFALDQMLRTLDLTWTYGHECLLITTPEVAEELVLARSYEVSDFPAFRDKNGKEVPDFDGLRKMLMCAVAPSTWAWDATGGTGSIATFNQGGLQQLNISQGWKTHLIIEELLTKLRQVRGPLPTDEQIGKLPPLSEKTDKPETVSKQEQTK